MIEKIDTIIEYPSGGKIDVYRTVDREASDYGNVFACCEYFAMRGAHVVIYPSFQVETVGNPVYEEIFASLKGTPYWGKCPDFTVDGVWYEHEGYDRQKELSDPKKRKLTYFNMLTRGFRQSERIIIEDCLVGRRYAKRAIFNRIHYEKQNISEVYIMTDTGLEILYKKETD